VRGDGTHTQWNFGQKEPPVLEGADESGKIFITNGGRTARSQGGCRQRTGHGPLTGPTTDSGAKKNGMSVRVTKKHTMRRRAMVPIGNDDLAEKKKNASKESEIAGEPGGKSK